MHVHIGVIIDFRNSVSVLLQTATLSFMLETEIVFISNILHASTKCLQHSSTSLSSKSCIEATEK